MSDDDSSPLPPPIRGGGLLSTIALVDSGGHYHETAHRLGLVPRLVMTPWWRSLAALERARYAAAEYGLVFPA